MVPPVGSSKPPIIRSVVVFPQPDGPSMAKKLPRSISSERSSTATTSSKRFVTFSMVTSAGTALPSHTESLLRKGLPVEPYTDRAPAARLLSTPVSRINRCARITGIRANRSTQSTTTWTACSDCPRRMFPKIHSGNVFCAPAVNVVTITSSNESANASRPPAISAVQMTGSVTKRKLCQPLAPRSIDASSSDVCVWRSRAITLLKTITMQNVAWPITIVQYERLIDQNWKNELSAMPVMIPGSAIGRTSSSEIDSLPKKRKRCSANAAALPSTIAIVVATTAALIDSQNALRISWLCQVLENHFVDRPSSGQPWTFDGLNA